MNNKLTFAYLLISEKVIRDESTGLLTIVDIFDSITIPTGQNSTIRTFYIIGKIYSMPAGKQTVIIKITDPETKEFQTIKATEKIKGGDVFLIIKSPLLIFEKIGKYSVNISIKGNRKDLVTDRFFLEVKKRKFMEEDEIEDEMIDHGRESTCGCGCDAGL